MISRPHNDEVEQRARLLVGLVTEHLPVEGFSRGPGDSWPLIGPALVARATGSLQAIMTLLPLDRDADALILLRSLYEHVTTFAWLSSEPTAERLGRWLKSDSVARIRADDDCVRLGMPILEADQRARLERTIASLPSEMPDLLSQAEAADNHWSGHIDGLDESGMPSSFRGLYAFAYRRFSAIAHPSNMGLNFVTTDLDGGGHRVDLEQLQPEMRGPFGLSTVVFALGLYVAEASLGWPAAAAIDSAMGSGS